MTMNPSPQENWHDLCQLLQNNLLSTSVPLMFNPLLQNPMVLNLKNESYEKLLLKYKRNYQMRETWEFLLTQGLTEVFKLRLLGSQADMDKYRKRSDKYLRVLNDMFGIHDSKNDLSYITQSFFSMLKDYLCRNMPFLPSTYRSEEAVNIMKKCREIYADRRLHDNPSTQEEPSSDGASPDVVRYFYIPFEEQNYTNNLLNQADEIAVDPKKHPKAQHYLVIAEHIQTLFIYVYMVEFVKKYPGMKGTRFEDNAASRHDRENNLFTFLSHADYRKYFFSDKQSADGE